MNFVATEKLNLFANVTYNMAEASLQDVVMPELDSEIADHLENQDFDYTNLPTYSDFDYKLLKLAGGFGYKLSPQVTLHVDGEYDDLTDDAGYVYGNESGSYFVVRSGIKINF